MKSSFFKILIVSCVVVGFLSCVTVYSADVSRRRHPNLAAAQTFIEKAIEKISEAQRVNEYDMGGHAAKAKALLDDAYTEIKLAAEAANVRR